VFGVSVTFHFLLERILPFFLGRELSGMVALYPSLLVNIDGVTWLRATALFPDPHVAAFFFGMVAFLALGLARHFPEKSATNLFILLFGAAILSFSRGGYLGLFIGGVSYFFLVQPRRFPFSRSGFVKVALFTGLGALLFAVPVLSRFFASFTLLDASSLERLTLWKAALLALAEKPFMGTGIGNYLSSVHPLASAGTPFYAHNLFLDTTLELGLVGGILFIGLFVATLFELMRSRGVATFAPALCAALSLYLVSSFFDTALFSVHVTALLSLMLAFAWNAKRFEEEAKTTQPSPLPTSGRNWPVPDWTTTLLGSVFLLFPIATLHVFDWPLYTAETAAGLAFLSILFRFSSDFVQLLKEFFVRERVFIASAGTFLLGVLIAAWINPHDLSTFGKLKSFYMVPALFTFLILGWATTQARLRWLILAWLASVTVASLAALIAFSQEWLLYDGRLAGPYQSANYLAMLVSPGILLAFSYFSESRSRAMKAACILALASNGAVLFLTHSYAAWAATIIALAVIIVTQVSGFSWRGRVSGVASILLVIGVMAWAESDTEKWQQVVSFTERSSLASRSMIWEVAIRTAKESSPWGIGTGRFQTVYLGYQSDYPPYLEWAVPTPHNLYLHFFLEGGLISLGAWLWIIGLSFHRAGRWFRQSPDRKREYLPLVALSLGLWVFYLVYGLVDTPYMKNDLALALWGTLGLFLASMRTRA